MQNLHGTAVLIGERGILITGPSGSGKTTLALALIERLTDCGLFCRLVADDQVLAACHGGRLVCTVPAAIAGLVEVPGIGPQPVAHEQAAVIDMIVRLVPAAGMARFQEAAVETVAGCALPRLDLAERDLTAAIPAITARLTRGVFA
jgi:serine kinase of HPr protein (carbohydrate metabolism regulator)